MALGRTRWLVWGGALWLALAGGCQMQCSLGQKDLQVERVDTRLTKQVSSTRADFELKVVGVSTVEEAGENAVDIEVRMHLQGPDGGAVELPPQTTGRFRERSHERIDFVTLQPYVELPLGFPLGRYEVTFEVTDHQANKTVRRTTDFSLE